ncbi:MAG TPA: gluconeogenesis factor YvcK family protein [Chloroflexia bacterium]|nr:gluconeogenesis factor YvcK family protein [Chloroflexia bacterium]
MQRAGRHDERNGEDRARDAALPRGIGAWLPAGLGLRPWAALLVAGLAIIGLGVAMFITNLYRLVLVRQAGASSLYWVTAQFIPHPWREILVGSLGVLITILGYRGLARAVRTAQQSGRAITAPAVLAPLRMSEPINGPCIVSIGGGTGQPTVLRGLKKHTDHITAVVTVADDGGSSGRLRRDLGILPPGDFRNCLIALSDVEPLLKELFQYRFGADAKDLEGHAFGNLFLVAMHGVTGDFELAVRECSRVLAVRGDVLPSTLADVTLHAELADGTVVSGESRLPKGKAAVRRVFLTPEHPHGYPDAVAAILEADLIVLGPGSLYTSLIPNLLVPDIVRAMRSSPAVKVYVCNVATQPGETDQFGVLEHVQALREHVGIGVFDYVLVNADMSVADHIQPEWQVQAVSMPAGMSYPGVEFIQAAVVNPNNPLRHDPDRLALALLDIYQQKRPGAAALSSMNGRTPQPV